jgi:hypothetical protein
MNRASITQTSYDFGRRLMEIADHLTRTRGFHWPIFLAAIDRQGEMLLLTIKTDWAGTIVHNPPGADGLHMSLYPPMHPPRRWRRNLHRYVVRPYRLGTCARTSRHEKRRSADCAETYIVDTHENIRSQGSVVPRQKDPLHG